MLSDVKAINMINGGLHCCGPYILQSGIDWFVRPDLIDVLFLGSFTDPFESVKRNKNINKRKNMHKIA